MKKILLVLENDAEIVSGRHSIIRRFMRHFNADKTIELTGLGRVPKEQIIAAVMECTDIACQTSFAGESFRSLQAMAMILAKIPTPKNIYIGASDIKRSFRQILEPEEIAAIEHHNIYDMFGGDYEGVSDHTKCEKIDFSDLTAEWKREQEEKRLFEKAKQEYLSSASDRPTGQKVIILACNASGRAFEGLPIGAAVDVLDCSKYDPNPNRGVWIMGNGEPIKLVNDCGLQEYELVAISLDTALEEIFKVYDLQGRQIKRSELIGFMEIMKYVQSGEVSTNEAANFFCEELDIPKRSNREQIRRILGKISSVAVSE